MGMEYMPVINTSEIVHDSFHGTFHTLMVRYIGGVVLPNCVGIFFGRLEISRRLLGKIEKCNITAASSGGFS